MRRLLAMTLIATGTMATGAQSSDAKVTLTGVIKSFECGDNCYLTILTPSGDEVDGLCAAIQCEPWNQKTTIPRTLIGAHVTVDVDAGTQLDGEGNDVGSFRAFTSVRIGR